MRTDAPEGRPTRYFKSWADVATKKYVDANADSGALPPGQAVGDVLVWDGDSWGPAPAGGKRWSQL